ncbi:MAG: leuE [Hydrocarboniphaga sp.]|uniref:leucine efflux protein LeuE n=1 Tax=Hydrocarboniphaga sp. TaxID=2033016 RepID=UPI0026307B73|nr:leucine efflux protein LeuE [Hydrocarboniphaga sp.]MDB5970739.1 leuE [Hydrocarboniphaga sp.]
MNSFGLIDLPTYLLGTLIIVLLPGPNSLFVLGTAARGGVVPAYRAACGVFLGDALLMVLAAGGVASLLKTYPAAFMVFKYVGAAYLIWIGVGMLLAAWRVSPLLGEGGPEGRERALSPRYAGPSPRRGEKNPFRSALLISLLNPKAIMFFMAFFIQFVDPAYEHTVLSFALLGLIAQTMSFIYLSTLIFAGARLATGFRSRKRLSAALSGGAGTLFLGFGAKLATASLT